MTAIHLPVATVRATSDQPSKAEAAAKRSTPAPNVPAKSSKARVDTVTTTSSSEPGVLRLIEQGHFKGVADVRLRINFADQLAQRQTQAQQATAQTQLGDLAGQVQTQVTSLLEVPELSETQTAAVAEKGETFSTALQAVQAGTAEAPSVDPQAIGDGVQAAFDELVGGLESILAGPAAEPATAGETGESGSAEPATPDSGTQEEQAGEPSSLLADLRATFESALATLRESLQATETLPPLSAPSGQGAAYAKFLAMYQQGQTEEASTSATPTSDGAAVDVVA